MTPKGKASQDLWPPHHPNLHLPHSLTLSQWILFIIPFLIKGFYPMRPVREQMGNYFDKIEKKQRVVIRRWLYLVQWGRKGYSNSNKTKFKQEPHFPKALKRGIETWEQKINNNNNNNRNEDIFSENVARLKKSIIKIESFHFKKSTWLPNQLPTNPSMALPFSLPISYIYLFYTKQI